ncbi:sodium-coupled monocarboxylate transporter 1-like [Amblyomma americanum]
MTRACITFSNPIQVVPYFMKERLSDVAVLRGLFLAGLLGASTSTVSSIVNSNAATFYIDIVAPYVKMSERTANHVVRILALASGIIMTLYAIAVPYMGTATRLFVSLYSSASGPFIGLILLAVSSPWVNAKGAAWASLLVCAIQLWHAVGRGLSAVPPPPVIPGTLDRCPPNTNGTVADLVGLSARHSPYVFPLYRLSFFWVGFFGTVVTLTLGTALSLVTGGVQRAPKYMHLTSPLFLNFWRRFKFLRQAVHLDGREAGNGTKVAPGQHYEEECVALSSELAMHNEGHESIHLKVDYRGMSAA